MLEKDIIQQIKDIHITPSATWKSESHAKVMAYVDARTNIGGEFFFWNAFLRLFEPGYFILRTGGVIALTVAVLFGGYITTVAAASASLPGDTLYNVKRADEEVTKIFLSIVNEPKIGEYELSLAQIRLGEAQQIAATTESTHTKVDKVKTAVSEAKTHIQKAKSQVSNLNNKGKTREAVKLAGIVDLQTTSLSKTLPQTEKTIIASLGSSSGEGDTTTEDTTGEKGDIDGVKEAIGETVKASEQAGKAALDVIIANYLAGESDFSEDEVKVKILSKLDEFTKRIVGEGESDGSDGGEGGDEPVGPGPGSDGGEGGDEPGGRDSGGEGGEPGEEPVHTTSDVVEKDVEKGEKDVKKDKNDSGEIPTKLENTISDEGQQKDSDKASDGEDVDKAGEISTQDKGIEELLADARGLLESGKIVELFVLLKEIDAKIAATGTSSGGGSGSTAVDNKSLDSTTEKGDNNGQEKGQGGTEKNTGSSGSTGTTQGTGASEKSVTSKKESGDVKAQAVEGEMIEEDGEEEDIKKEGEMEQNADETQGMEDMNLSL